MRKADKQEEIKKIVPFTTKDLSGIYGVSNKTFLNWIKPHSDKIGERRGRFYSVNQVQIIFDKLGRPYTLSEL